MTALAQRIEADIDPSSTTYLFAERTFRAILDGVADPEHAAFGLVPDGTANESAAQLVLWELAAHEFAVALAGASDAARTDDEQREAVRVVGLMLDTLARRLPAGVVPATVSDDVTAGRTWPAWTAATITKACREVAPADVAGQVAGQLVLGYHRATAAHGQSQDLAAQSVAAAVAMLDEPGTQLTVELAGMVTTAEEVFGALERTDAESSAQLAVASASLLRKLELPLLAAAGRADRQKLNQRTSWLLNRRR